MNFEYLLVGYGKLATHLAHYFTLKGLNFRQVSSRGPLELNLYIEKSTTILLAISDDALEGFSKSYPQLKTKQLVHFSGAQVLKEAQSCHPLMSFGKSLYFLEDYEQIPFIYEKGKISFQELFPNLNNPHFSIDPREKKFYHALCVSGGNFTTMLWQSVFFHFEQTLHLPKKILLPYLEQIVANIKADSDNALTGPIARRDEKTIHENIKALEGDPLQRIYKDFVELYNKREVCENSRLY